MVFSMNFHEYPKFLQEIFISIIREFSKYFSIVFFRYFPGDSPRFSQEILIQFYREFSKNFPRDSPKIFQQIFQKTRFMNFSGNCTRITSVNTQSFFFLKCINNFLTGSSTSFFFWKFSENISRIHSKKNL